LLGDHAQHVFAPKSQVIGALVTLPAGQSPEALGLEPFVAGFARLHASPADLVSYAAAHPGLHIEVAPPLRPLLDMAGHWIHSTEAHEQLGVDGTGVLVGVADTGLDVNLPDFRDPTTGKSRVAWILDLSLPPAGIYPDLEDTFCIKGAGGACRLGAVLQGKDIDALLASPLGRGVPTDEVGHGTHVTSIAAGNGGPARKYVGGAPGAQIVVARVTRDDGDDTIQNDDILTGVSFLFNRANAMNLPISVNLSIGSDFGPHDGSTSWEKALAGFVGDGAPGRALSVAAGNSGSIALTPIHQTVYVPAGQVLSVPIPTHGSTYGTVLVWVTFTSGTSLSVGLDGPDGTWIAPVANGQQRNQSTSNYAATISNGNAATQIEGAEIPAGSNGAVVVWDASETSGSTGWPSGTYAITFAGEGTADLWVQSTATNPDGTSLGFSNGVREGTIGLPATEPSLISVGCTVNRATWTSIDDAGWGLTETIPGLDPAGGLVVTDGGTPFFSGEACGFSSSGPNVLGVPKPEISAPGAWVIAALSGQATPGTLQSIFTSSPGECPLADGGSDSRCFEVDTGHAVAEGTSMSAPMVTGAVALFLQRDPTLTQGQIVPILQGGAHYFRSFPLGSVEFEDQGGPGELDVLGSLAVMNLMKDPARMLPSAAKSWLTLSTDYVLADGSTPTVAILELRTEDGGHAADLFDPAQLQAVALLDGSPLDPPPSVVRRGPGVWLYSVQVRPGSGGQSMTFGATFNGEDVVQRRTVPVSTDPWTASYASPAGGGCGVAPWSFGQQAIEVRSRWCGALLAVATLGIVKRRRIKAVRPRR
jgi:subtilisin family serine protease